MATKYTVDISPEAKAILVDWVDICEADNGVVVAEELLDGFESMIEDLENNPLSGTARLVDIPKKYRAYHLWEHLWSVYQIYEDDRVIKIEYIIDDRQNYKMFVV